MTRGSQARPGQRRILVFGEDPTDSELIRELIVALCPQAEGLVKIRRKPQVLIKNARPGAQVRSRADAIKAVVSAERADAEIICVFAHEDCDKVEPASDDLARRIEDALRDIGCPVHAVTPAWETEAWLFLWPAAVGAYRPKWQALPSAPHDTGQIRNAKEELRRVLRPSAASGTKVPDYQTTDAPVIAAKVRELGLARKPTGTSASYDRFCRSVDSCCRAIAQAGTPPHRQRGIAANR
jgi:hypothetical protein